MERRKLIKNLKSTTFSSVYDYSVADGATLKYSVYFQLCIRISVTLRPNTFSHCDWLQ